MSRCMQDPLLYPRIVMSPMLDLHERKEVDPRFELSVQVAASVDVIHHCGALAYLVHL